MVARVKKPQWQYDIHEDGDAACQLPGACSAAIVPTKDGKFEWFFSHSMRTLSGLAKSRESAQRCAIKAYRTYTSTKE